MPRRFDRARWFAENIRKRRQELGLSEAELAARAKTTPRVVERLEAGQALLTSTGSHRVIEVLGLDGTVTEAETREVEASR